MMNFEIVHQLELVRDYLSRAQESTDPYEHDTLVQLSRKSITKLINNIEIETAILNDDEPLLKPKRRHEVN